MLAWTRWMSFSGSAWLGEIITGTLAGFGAGVMGALLFPMLGASPFLGAAAGAATGFLRGSLAYPLKWFWGDEQEGRKTVVTVAAADRELPQGNQKATKDSYPTKENSESKSPPIFSADEDPTRAQREHV